MTQLEEACAEYHKRIRANQNATMAMCQVVDKFSEVSYEQLSDATLRQMFTKTEETI